MKRQVLLFLVAVQFLTRLPVPHLDGFQASWLSRSVRYIPLVGVLSDARRRRMVAELLVFSAGRGGRPDDERFLATDGRVSRGRIRRCLRRVWRRKTRDSVLSIMKDSRVGAYGAIGIAMLLGLNGRPGVAPAWGISAVVIAAHLVSRWCATGLIWRLRYARTEADAVKAIRRQFEHGGLAIERCDGRARPAARAVAPGA